MEYIAFGMVVAGIIGVITSQFLNIRKQQKINYMFHKSIVGNRERISKLNSAVAKLDQQVWNLQEHTPEESLERVKEALTEFQTEAKKYVQENLDKMGDDGSDTSHD